MPSSGWAKYSKFWVLTLLNLNLRDPSASPGAEKAFVGSETTVFHLQKGKLEHLDA